MLLWHIGIIGYDHIHEEVLQLLGEGKFKDIEKLITRKIKIDDIVEDGLKRLIREKDRQGWFLLPGFLTHGSSLTLVLQ
jgi:hypothetical protein